MKLFIVWLFFPYLFLLERHLFSSDSFMINWKKNQRDAWEAHLPPSALIALQATFVLMLQLPTGNVRCSEVSNLTPDVSTSQRLLEKSHR